MAGADDLYPSSDGDLASKQVFLPLLRPLDQNFLLPLVTGDGVAASSPREDVNIFLRLGVFGWPEPAALDLEPSVTSLH